MLSTGFSSQKIWRVKGNSESSYHITKHKLGAVLCRAVSSPRSDEFGVIGVGFFARNGVGGKFCHNRQNVLQRTVSFCHDRNTISANPI